MERAAKRIAKQEDDKQIEWKMFRDDIARLGNSAGWAQYQRAAASGRYSYINRFWSGSDPNTWTRYSSQPVAYFLMNIKKQTFLPTSTPAAPTNPTYHQDLGGATDPTPTLQSRPNQLRVTDTIKIKNINIIVDCNYPVPAQNTTVIGGVTYLAEQYDDRGFQDVYCKLLRVKGTTLAVSPQFVLPDSAVSMLRPKGFHYEKLLDEVMSDSHMTGNVQVVESKKVRIYTSTSSQRKIIRLNWHPKNPKLYRFMLNSNNPNSVQAPMFETYFLQVYTTSPQPGSQPSPSGGNVHLRGRVLVKVDFCDAQL